MVVTYLAFLAFQVAFQAFLAFLAFLVAFLAFLACLAFPTFLVASSLKDLASVPFVEAYLPFEGVGVKHSSVPLKS